MYNLQLLQLKNDENKGIKEFSKFNFKFDDKNKNKIICEHMDVNFYADNKKEIEDMAQEFKKLTCLELELNMKKGILTSTLENSVIVFDCF